MKVTDRQRRIAAKKLADKMDGEFTEVAVDRLKFPTIDRAFRNNRYTVMIKEHVKTTHGNAIRAMIQKHDNSPFINHWKVLQTIKNQIFGKGVLGIEYYPPESELIDNYNIYWLWIFPDGIIPKQIQ